MCSAYFNVIFMTFPAKVDFNLIWAAHSLDENATLVTFWVKFDKKSVFHDFEWLKIINESGKHKQMKVHSLKKSIHENLLYYGDFGYTFKKRFIIQVCPV